MTAHSLPGAELKRHLGGDRTAGPPGAEGKGDSSETDGGNESAGKNTIPALQTVRWPESAVSFPKPGIPGRTVTSSTWRLGRLRNFLKALMEAGKRKD